MRTLGKLAVCALGMALASFTPACGGEGSSDGTTSDPNAEEDLGFIGGKADGDPIRTVALTVEAGATKRYRITATGFLAKLTQTGEVPAQLSAKHYEIDIYGEVSSAPAVEARADGSLRNWTLRVENLGTETLYGELVVTELETDRVTEIGIISDIDKTLLPPSSDDELPPYPGIAQILQHLEFGNGGEAGDMYFVTARKPERVVDLPEWMATHGIPAGPIETGTSGIPWIAQPEKVKDMSGIMDANPTQRFVLFGDSSQADPEVLVEISAKYPGRTAALFIHDVEPIDAARLEGIKLIQNYAQAAAELYRVRLLDEEAARGVMTTAREQGLEITDEEIDQLIAENRPE